MSALILTGGFARKACSQGQSRRTVRRMRNLQRPYLQGFTVSCSIEGEVKRKYLSHRWSFSCFQPHVLEQRRFRPALPFAQTLNMSAQRIRLFLSAVFIASFATKPVRSETHKQNGFSGNHSSIRDSWPIAISGYPR